MISLVWVQAKIKANGVDVVRLAHLPFGPSKGDGIGRGRGTDVAPPPTLTPRDSVINAIPRVLSRDNWLPAIHECIPLDTPFQKEKKKYILWGSHEIYLSTAARQVAELLIYLAVCFLKSQAT